MIITFSWNPSNILFVLVVVLALMSLGLQFARYFNDRKTRTRTDTTLFILEVLTITSLLVCLVGLIFVYQGYIPWNSPGYLPYIAPYGVIASNADPSKFAVMPTVTYPAVTFAAAVVAYKNSPNGFTTGVFAWDGVAVTILTPGALNLRDGAPPGTSWVFQDLNTAVARSQ